MTSVSIDRVIAEDLINSKISHIRQEINQILIKWDASLAEMMIELTRNGELAEAEVDAISMTNLLENLAKYEQLVMDMDG